MQQSRDLLPEEIKDQFMKNVWHLIECWESGNGSIKDCVQGFAKDFFGMIENGTSTFPPMILAPRSNNSITIKLDDKPFTYPNNDKLEVDLSKMDLSKSFLDYDYYSLKLNQEILLNRLKERGYEIIEFEELRDEEDGYYNGLKIIYTKGGTEQFVCEGSDVHIMNHICSLPYIDHIIRMRKLKEIV